MLQKIKNKTKIYILTVDINRLINQTFKNEYKISVQLNNLQIIYYNLIDPGQY